MTWLFYMLIALPGVISSSGHSSRMKPQHAKASQAHGSSTCGAHGPASTDHGSSTSSPCSCSSSSWHRSTETSLLPAGSTRRCSPPCWPSPGSAPVSSTSCSCPPSTSRLRTSVHLKKHHLLRRLSTLKRLSKSQLKKSLPLTRETIGTEK